MLQFPPAERPKSLTKAPAGRRRRTTLRPSFRMAGAAAESSRPAREASGLGFARLGEELGPGAATQAQERRRAEELGFASEPLELCAELAEHRRAGPCGVRPRDDDADEVTERRVAELRRRSSSPARNSSTACRAAR